MLRAQARSIYGLDASTYDVGRPDYPRSIYEILTSRCGLQSEASVLESGPGTGLVTRHLLEAGARVTAVEPDERMVEFLAARFPTVEVVASTFEHATLDPRIFDLFVAATSFHWVDQTIGIPKLAALLKPGGWAAIWWTVFGDPEQSDPFLDELRMRTGEDDPGGQRNVKFQMDLDARERDLRELGRFEMVSGEVHQWTVNMSSTQLQSLYASFIQVARRPPDQKRQFLEQVAAVAEDLGAQVARPFVTALYTARKPGA
jgi:SAM-dependent methyltransferase